MANGTPASGLSGRSGDYEPRRPEDSLLYKTIAGNLETFLARQQERGREVPRFVQRELRTYLSCGILACGFLRLRCQSCGDQRLLPLSCKGRAICPSCCGRRMADTAAHLVDGVFPEVPVRQWVLSLPYALRYRLAYDAGMVTAVLKVFMRALFGFYRRLARDCGIEGVQCGAVTFVQRFGSSANLNLHFHSLAIDGVYAPGRDGKPEFFPLRPPENGEVWELAETLARARRLGALMKRRSMAAGELDGEDSDRLSRDEPWLSAVYAASVCGRLATGLEAGRKVVVGGDRVDLESLDAAITPRCAAVNGFSVHANVAITARDRSRLERLIRYAARPPLAMERLEALPDGKLRYGLKTPWRNGTTHAVFEPLEFLEKLSALVPTPRAHLVRFHGVLGPAAKWRPEIVPAGGAMSPPPDSNDALPARQCGAQTKRRGRKNHTWSELLRRVFAVDVTTCKDCGGPIRIVAVIRAPEIVRKILDHIGLPSRPPPLTPARIQAFPFAFE